MNIHGEVYQLSLTTYKYTEPCPICAVTCHTCALEAEEEAEAQAEEEAYSQTPTTHEPVRATVTRFKQYLFRAIEERQVTRQRLLNNPKSAPVRQEQKRRRQWARGQERYTKAFVQHQELC